VQFIEHTLAGTRPGTTGSATFEFDWTPPATNSGNVVLYAAGNAANGDGNVTGDHIYNASVELSVSTPPAPATSSTYTVQNLVSDVPGLAAQTDPNLINPWGVALNANGPFWISKTIPAPLRCAMAQVSRSQPRTQCSYHTGQFADCAGLQWHDGVLASRMATRLLPLRLGVGNHLGWNPAVDPAMPRWCRQLFLRRGL
jgi:hypothetical protein